MKISLLFYSNLCIYVFHIPENIENDVSTAVNISKDKNTVETLTPKTSETLNSLMMDHFTTDSNEADDDDDNEEDALVKWRDSSSLSDTVSDQGGFLCLG